MNQIYSDMAIGVRFGTTFAVCFGRHTIQPSTLEGWTVLHVWRGEGSVRAAYVVSSLQTMNAGNVCVCVQQSALVSCDPCTVWAVRVRVLPTAWAAWSALVGVLARGLASIANS